MLRARLRLRPSRWKSTIIVEAGNALEPEPFLTGKGDACKGGAIDA
jgi:hypothetical protein